MMKFSVAAILALVAPTNASIQNTDLICSMQSMGMQFGGKWEESGPPTDSPPLRLKLNIAQQNWCSRSCDFLGQMRLQNGALILESVGDPNIPKSMKQEGTINLADWSYTNTITSGGEILSILRYRCVQAPFTGV